MLSAVLLVVLMLAGYFLLRKHILARFTDPVTHRNRKRLGAYLLLLIGLFWLLLLWMAAPTRS